MEQTLILASGSPRRKELIGYMGLAFEVITAPTEETNQGSPKEVVMENARRKARAVARLHPGRIVLGADTVVAQGESVLGKPTDPADARAMLSRLSGKSHEVYTGVCIVKDDYEDVRADRTEVFFTPIDEEAIARYVETGEPMDKAGAYALQGRGGMFVSRIEGSYSNVIGLPMALTREMLQAAGIENL